MFELDNASGIRRLAIALAILSATSLIFTLWILWDVGREQEIVARIIGHLPASDLAVAQELSGDLRMQSSLSLLLGLNIIATAIALAAVVRGYLSSEQSLRDVKVLAVDILASMDVGVVTTDTKGTVTSINPRGIELLGGSQAIVGRHLNELSPEYSVLRILFDEVMSQRVVIRDRDIDISSSGQLQVLRLGCTLLCNRSGDQIGTVIQLRDVTQKQLNEQRLRRMERFMGLGTLAAGLQHEIRNPLAALSLHVQLLAEKIQDTTSDAEAKELLDIVKTEVRRIQEVLDGFRNYASVGNLGRSKVEACSLVTKLIRFLRPQTESQQVDVRFLATKCHQPFVEADAAQLEQVLLNLALNALAAMPEGGTLTFEIENQQNHLRIHVEDSGTGIPPEIQAQVFDPYFTTHRDGTGMGLALCDKIARQHGGGIDFQSSSSGTRFTLSVPCKDEL